MLGIKPATVNDELHISKETSILLDNFGSLNDKISRIEKIVRPLSDFTSIEDWRDETFRSKISNKYEVSIDLSQFLDEKDDEAYIFNYDENMKVRDFLDHVYFQIEQFGVKAFTYEYDWIIFNDSTKTELRVKDKQAKFRHFEDNRTLLSAKIFPFNKLIVNKI